MLTVAEDLSLFKAGFMLIFDIRCSRCAE